MELAFWIPVLVIFASALLGAIVKRYTTDPCLKVFNKSFVFVRLKDGRWLSGDLIVFSNCLELIYRDPESLPPRYEKLSYVLYEQNLDSIERVMRPSPPEKSADREHWVREIYRLQNPSAIRRIRRRIRNWFNMLRDAVAQSVTVVFGAMKKRTRLGALPVDEAKVGEMGRTLISAVPNAYEPILEKYLGRKVVIETPRGEQLLLQSGVLQEYSGKFLLVRDVDLLPEIPPGSAGRVWNTNFDVAFPRSMSWVRNLARHKPANRGTL